MISRRTMMNDEIVTKTGEVISLQKCKGSYFNELSLYGKSTQFSTTGAQLIDPDAIEKSRTGNGVTITNENGIFYASGTFTGGQINLQPIKRIPIKSGEYILSGGLTDFYPLIEINDKYIVGNIVRPFVVETDTTMNLFIRVQTDVSKTPFIKPMINKGKTALPYEPYTGGKPSPSIEYSQEIVNAAEDKGNINVKITGNNEEQQTLTISTPNGLPGIPVNKDGNYTDETGQQWICDESDLGRRKYVKRVEVVKAKDLTWKADFFGEETNRIYRYSTSMIPDLIDRLNGLSNCFRYKTGSSIKSNEFVVEEKGELRVIFETPFESIDTLMEWFRQKETVFYLPRNPIEHDLPPEVIEQYEKLHTYSPNTTVINDSEVGMSVTYRKVRG